MTACDTNTTRAMFERALAAAQALHGEHPDLSAFAEWPSTLDYCAQQPNPIPVAHRIVQDAGLAAGHHAAACDALTAPAMQAKWRATYPDATIGAEFNAHFGSYELLGRDGHFIAHGYSGFVIYLSADLWYPWHTHPAEEIYVVLAGRARFHAEGTPPRDLGPGGTAHHAGAQPHAVRAGPTPVLCYAAWRGDTMTRPVLCPAPENATAR